MTWTETHDRRLRELAAEHHLAGAARAMGISVHEAWRRVRIAKIRPLTLKQACEPTEGEWIGAASQAAQEARIRVSLVLGGSSCRNACRARWRAWRRLLDENPQYSMAGLGRVCGYDHTTILWGLTRLAELG